MKPVDMLIIYICVTFFFFIYFLPQLSLAKISQSRFCVSTGDLPKWTRSLYSGSRTVRLEGSVSQAVCCVTHTYYIYILHHDLQLYFHVLIINLSHQWSARLSREEHPGEQSCHQTDGDPTSQHGGALFLFCWECFRQRRP